MRPVERGDRPVRFDSRGKIRQEQAFSRYAQARRYLICKLGAFCSYCEQPLPNPAVEHIDPKSLYRGKTLDWNNFLLVCTNCNSVKLNTDINDSNRHQYYWPHVNNTFLAFEYDGSGIVKPSNFVGVDRQRSKKTIALFGLDKIAPRAGTIKYEEASDRRFENRLGAWMKAKRFETRYLNTTEDKRSEFLELFPDVIDTGFYSVWMTVFQNHPEVKRVICETFPGTATGCFDANFDPTPRNGTDI